VALEHEIIGLHTDLRDGLDGLVLRMPLGERREETPEEGRALVRRTVPGQWRVRQVDDPCPRSACTSSEATHRRDLWPRSFGERRHHAPLAEQAVLALDEEDRCRPRVARHSSHPT
jgi:hypothetical protein